MDDEIQLGYQASVVSLESPTFRWLWLSIAHHPGDTASCTQAEALALAVEDRLGLRPRRRIDLLRQRIEAFDAAMTPTVNRLNTQLEAIQTAQARLEETHQEIQDRQLVLTELEQGYQAADLSHASLQNYDSSSQRGSMR